jgi:DNA polymerase alpha subunit A
MDVIYGDTDSIMINSNSKDLESALNMAKKVKEKINKIYKRMID